MQSNTAFSSGQPNQVFEKVVQEAMQRGRRWNMSVNLYNQSQQVVRVDNCFGFMFTNVGDVIAAVNGMRIFPNANPATGLGDSRGVSGHWLDLYAGIINLSFQNPTLGVAPLVEIVQFFYVPGTVELSNI